MRSLTGFVVGAAVLLCPPLAVSETQLSADTTMNLEYNDNPRLLTGGGGADWIRYLSARGGLEVVQPRTSLSLTPSVDVRRYAHDTALDSEDYGLDLAAQQDYERSSAQIQAGYSRVSLQSDQFDGIGIIHVGERREQWNVGPAWTADLNPFLSATARAAHSAVAFDSQGFSQPDYTIDSASASLARDLGEAEQLSMTLSASRFDIPSIDNRIDQAGVQVLYARDLSESIKVSGLLGGQLNRFKLDSLPVKSKKSVLLDLTLEGEQESGTWRFNVSRSVDPSETGTVMRSDTARVSMSHQMSPSWSGSCMFMISDRKDLQRLNPGDDSVYLHGEVGIGWEFAESWKLSAAYRAIRQRLRSAGAATASEALVSLSYHADLWARNSGRSGSE